MSDEQPMRRIRAAPSATSPIEPVVIALAKKTHAPIALVKTLYDREVAVLEAQSTIKRFIGLLACKRVKRYLETHPDARASPTD